MRSSVAIASVVSLAMISAAHAEMPHYDVERYCTEIASLGGSMSQMMLQSCYTQEQTAYNALKPRWDSLPEAMRTYCDQIAAVGGGGSYMMLESCVKQEESAASSNTGFHFKR